MKMKSLYSVGRLCAIAAAFVCGHGVLSAQIFSNATAVSAGGAFGLALKSDGTVWSWGQNLYGELGDGGGGSSGANPTPRAVFGLSNIEAVSAGLMHGGALEDDGTVWTWGDNSSGQLGDGTTTSSLAPVQASISNVVFIKFGPYCNVAVKSDGTVWTWGYSAGTSTPTQVSGLSGIVSAAFSWGTGIALKSDGTVWTWGNNSFGQLGDGTTTSNSTPTQVSSLSGVVAVESTGATCYALKSDGSVAAWGRNYAGQVGDGTTTNKTSPVTLSGISNVVSIEAGADYCTAVKSNGTVWGWGVNYASSLNGLYPQVANYYTSPVQEVTGITTGSKSSGGANNLITLVLLSNGDIKGYGSNWEGALGY